MATAGSSGSASTTGIPMAIRLLLLSLAGLCAVEADVRYLSAVRGGPWQYQIIDGYFPGAELIASFNNTINETGWSFLSIRDYRGNRNTTDEELAYLAGVMEVNLTASLMEMHWQNTMGNYCANNPDLCDKIVDFILENDVYTGTDKDMNDPRWYQTHLFKMQMTGMSDAYSQMGLELLPDYSFMFFQIYGDLDDLVSALTAANSSLPQPKPGRVLGSGSCSAIVKLLPDQSDLLVGHNTWTHYQEMLRIFKLYQFNYHTSSNNDTVIPGHTQAFSSYPGRIYSGDDFYMISSGLVAMETSIGNSNPSLWKYVTPKSIFENQRVILANRLSSSGPEWGKHFSIDNSGTYNNEWMIIDYNEFESGKKPGPGLLVVVEQMPGKVMYEDLTNYLVRHSYWPSYNIPYFSQIYKMSGTGESAQKFGDWFTWDGAPRAKIFARNHTSVTDVPSLIELMKYNDFKNDNLSVCECTPPYSGENGIAARSDLNPPDGTYPFPALSHRLHGAIDMKVTSSELFPKKLTCYASSGPTSSQQPPFQWSTSGNPSGIPLGHPDKWDFDTVLVNWNL